MVLELCRLRIDQPNDLLFEALDAIDRLVVEDLMLSADEASLADSSFRLSLSDWVW